MKLYTVLAKLSIGMDLFFVIWTYFLYSLGTSCTTSSDFFHLTVSELLPNPNLPLCP